MKSGKRGCFMSHKFMIERFLTETSDQVALFFEDDIVLSPYGDTAICLAEVQAAGLGGSSSWDMLLLGYGMNTTGNWLPGTHPHKFTVKKFWGSHAYALTRSGAQKLVVELSSSPPILQWRGVDIDRQISQYAVEAGFRMQALIPSLMYQNAAPSNILAPLLNKGRTLLFSHNNGITGHRAIELATSHASWILLVSGSIILVVVILVWRRGLPPPRKPLRAGQSSAHQIEAENSPVLTQTLKLHH